MFAPPYEFVKMTQHRRARTKRAAHSHCSVLGIVQQTPPRNRIGNLRAFRRTGGLLEGDRDVAQERLRRAGVEPSVGLLRRGLALPRPH